MKLCDKIRYLREVEGELRGLGRAMTQGEVVKAMREEMAEANGANGSLSQSYLSQPRRRPHKSRTITKSPSTAKPIKYQSSMCPT